VSQVFFFIAAIGALAGAIGVVAIRNPFYSVLSLVFHLICLAALFLLLRAEFVAAAQVIVYAGAVMVLYVFVVAYVGGSEEPTTRLAPPGGSALKVIGPLLALALAVELCIATLGTALKGVSGKGAPYIPGFGTPAHIGKLFLTTYLLPFEIASLLLLVAAIGAVMLARRRGGLEPDEQLEELMFAPRAANTGTMAEGIGAARIGSSQPPEAERSGAPGAGRPREPAGRGGDGWLSAARSRERVADGDRLVPRGFGADLQHRRGRCADAPQPARGPAVPGADAERRQPGAGGVRADARRRGWAGVRADRDGRRGL
jgi:NADH-quinone oxidoreductase subunit J